MEKILFIFTTLLIYTIKAAGKDCPNCGTTTVPYPLSTSPDCGDPNYQISCENTTGVLRFNTLNGSSYAITSIHPEIQRFVIRPANFSGNRCLTTDLRSQGIQLNQSLPFNVTSSNTILLLNCTQRLLLSPLNCSSASLCHSYIRQAPEAAACRETSICCTFVAGGSSTSYSVRVSGTGCNAYRSFVNLNPRLPLNSWPEGVEIQWVSPREPVCRSQSDCGVGSNSTCSPDPVVVGRSRCFCIENFRWDPFSGTCANNVTNCETSGSCHGSNRAPLIAGLASGVGVALLATLVGILVYKRQRRIKEAKDRITREREEILSANSSGKSARLFSGKEMKKATNGFSADRLLGSGGYGDVFKGFLDDGTIIAVKSAKVGNIKGTEQVLNEVRILSQVNHRNLVRLLGCCVELEQPLMVYEYIPNGTLYEHLHSLRAGTSLDWRRRLSIAHQTAQGLAYLHSSAFPPIYHRDVKSSNILLDEKLNARVADFGLSRLAEPDLSHVSTCAQGTLGYLDPEYYRNYQLTDKSDVYSFGVVLLELLTSKKVIDFTRVADDVNLAVYVQQRVEAGRLMDVVDDVLKAGVSDATLGTMKALGFLAMGCLEERRQNRPSMKEVAEEIEYIMSIEAAGVIEQEET